jgi:YebC/PmpR family DNA-binding regulatory protein
MSGHSKWSTIKHKKAALDARRGKAWSKIARDITTAAKMGGGDPDANPRLRLAIDKARSANMPKDNVERAIKKGTGELDGESYEEITYEGYGPGGVAVLCRALTDNRTRTAPEIKKIFERHGGNLGQPNSVSWMFKSRGVIVLAPDAVDEDRLMELALEAGADDVSSSAVCHEVTCTPEAFLQVKAALEAAGLAIQSAEVTMVAGNTVTARDVETASKVVKLLDALEEHDDVQSVSSNADIPDDIAAQLGD